MRSAIAWTRPLAVLLVLLVATIAAVPDARAASRPATLPPSVLALSARLRGQPMQCVPFVQRKHLVALQRELQFRGALSVAADAASGARGGRRVVWRIDAPLRAEYQFLPDSAWRRAGDQPWARLAVPDAASRAIHGMLSALLDLDPGALTRQFDVRVLADAPLRFEAVPREARLRQVIAKVTVQAGTRIDVLRIDEAAGNWSEYRFAPPPAAGCVLPAIPGVPAASAVPAASSAVPATSSAVPAAPARAGASPAPLQPHG